MGFEIDSFGVLGVIVIAAGILCVPLLFMIAWNGFASLWFPKITYWQSSCAIVLLAFASIALKSSNIEVNK